MSYVPATNNNTFDMTGIMSMMIPLIMIVMIMKIMMKVTEEM